MSISLKSLYSSPTKKKCIHVIAFDDYQPEMCEITIPNLKSYAKKIGADFNLIREVKFPGFPPNYERFQIYESGRDYEWNFNIDADTLLHPDCEDPTEWLDPTEFGSLWGMSADAYFKCNKYFIRDGRNQAIADQFTVSNFLIHDIWEPLRMTFEEASSQCPADSRQVSEFALSLNLARFGIRHQGALKDHSKHFSPMVTGHKVEKPADVMRAKLKEWGCL